MKLWQGLAASVLGHTLVGVLLCMGSVTAMHGGRRYIEVRLISSGDFCQPGSGVKKGAAGGGGAVAETGSETNALLRHDIANGENESEKVAVQTEPLPAVEPLPEKPPAPKILKGTPDPAHRSASPRRKRKKEKPSETTAEECAAVVNDRFQDAASASGVSSRTAPSEGQGASLSKAGGQGAGGGGPGGDVYGGGGIAEIRFGASNGPQFLSRVRPNYPYVARRLGKEGTVLLRVTIDERGRATEVELLKKAGSGFDEEAVEAVRNSTYVPATRNGRPVTCRAILPIRFVLKDPG